MDWAKKDWEDLLLMMVGACIGVVSFGFGVGPLLGVEFIGDDPFNYVMASAMGTVLGYLTRLSFLMISGGEKSKQGYPSRNSIFDGN